MLFRGESSIHSAFMRFEFDAVFMDRELRVVGLAERIPPWRARAAKGSRNILELAAGEISRTGVAVGDQLAEIETRDADPAIDTPASLTALPVPPLQIVPQLAARLQRRRRSRSASRPGRGLRVGLIALAVAVAVAVPAFALTRDSGHHAAALNVPAVALSARTPGSSRARSRRSQAPARPSPTPACA